MARVRVFQIAYDASLLQVRAEMLKHAGFEVSSALGNTEAQRILDEQDGYALIVIGWSANDGTRQEMVRWIKQHAPRLRVIALYNMRGNPNTRSRLQFPQRKSRRVVHGRQATACGTSLNTAVTALTP